MAFGQSKHCSTKKGPFCWSLIILACFCCPCLVESFKKAIIGFNSLIVQLEPMVSRFSCCCSLGRTCRLVQAECEAGSSKADDQNKEVRGTEHGLSANKHMLSNRLRFVKTLSAPRCRCQIGLLVSAICPGQCFSLFHLASAVSSDVCF